MTGTDDPVAHSLTEKRSGKALHTARCSIRMGSFRATAKVRVGTGGLLAIGALTSSILLSTAVLVWSATNVARRRAPQELGHK